MADSRLSLGTPVGLLSIAAIMGSSGFLGLRLYMRVRTRNKIDETNTYATLLEYQQLAARLGFDMNLPPKATLVNSLVPLWSMATPFEAVDDIVARGRKSKFWPAAYRVSDIPVSIEKQILQTLAEFKRKQQDLDAQEAAQVTG
jgi:hypothetical protein